MRLLTALILYIQITWSSSRSLTHNHHGHSNGFQQLQDNYNDIEQLKELLDGDLPDDFIDPENYGPSYFDVLSENTEMRDGREAAHLTDTYENDFDNAGILKSSQGNGELRSARDSEEENTGESSTDLESNAELISLVADYEYEDSVERYMKNFLFDMISLFQHDIKEFADREKSSTHQRRKRRRRKPSLRPKRSIRSLLRDAHIKDILMKYFRQKQKEENGKPLFRYG